MVQHKHVLINAKVLEPMRDPVEGCSFLTQLVKAIDMKVIQGPYSSYVDVPGNRGLTGIVMIETSHIAFHIWDEQQPGLLQFDLYTCGELKMEVVLMSLRKGFNLASLEYKLFDRADGFVLEQHGRL